MERLRSKKAGQGDTERYRFVKVNGVMVKVKVSSADSAFEAAMKVRNGKRKAIDKELLIHGVTS